MDIEAVAHDTPEKVINFDIDPATGFMPHHGRTLSKALDLKGDLAKQAGKLGKILYEGFLAKDMAMLVELRDETEEDAKEIEASKYDLSYVALDGNIG